jgi:zinc transport system permease protein
MLDVLTAPFMVRALLAAAVTGLAAPAVGTFLVQRRLALMGDGIGHICVTGVALGLITGTSPTLAAIAIAVLGALLIELIRISGRTSGDVALALLFYGGIAGGLVLLSIAGGGAAALQGYLFGSITTVSSTDVLVTAVLGLVVVVLCVALLHQFFSVASGEAFARPPGLRVDAYTVLISVLAAVSVSVAMRTVGLLLVSALMVIPVATAQQFSRGFRMTLFVAMGLGLAASVVGLVFTTFVDSPPGATIVLVALAGFVATWPVGYVVHRRRRMRVPFPADDGAGADGHAPVEHEHAHGPGCGHPAVEHGDHVDYIHDGERHAVHGGHYDEH